jgi:hypothetical protein
MNLSELLQKTDLSQKDKLLTILYLGGKSRYSIGEIKKIAEVSGLRAIKTWNISAILAAAKTLAIHYPDGWSVTTSAIAYLNGKGVSNSGSSPVVQVASDLRVLLPSIKNGQVKSFVEEAIGCVESSHYRAAVVLSWVGAISVLQDYVVCKHLTKFNAEAKRVNPKWKDASTADHIGLMDEGDFLDLLASPNVGVLGKNVKEELKNTALKLRNGCGHPNSMVVGKTRVAAHVEMLILNIFSRFL